MSNLASIELNGTKLQVKEGKFHFSFIGRCRGCFKHCKTFAECNLHTNDHYWDEFEFHFRKDCGKLWWKKHPEQARKEFLRCLREEKFEILDYDPFWDVECETHLQSPIKRFAYLIEQHRKNERKKNFSLLHKLFHSND